MYRLAKICDYGELAVGVIFSCVAKCPLIFSSTRAHAHTLKVAMS